MLSPLALFFKEESHVLWETPSYPGGRCLAGFPRVGDPRRHLSGDRSGGGALCCGIPECSYEKFMMPWFSLLPLCSLEPFPSSSFSSSLPRRCLSAAARLGLPPHGPLGRRRPAWARAARGRCVYVCMCVYVHVSDACVYLCFYVCVCACVVHVCLYTCGACMYARVCGACVYTCAVRVCVCVCVYGVSMCRQKMLLVAFLYG